MTQYARIITLMALMAFSAGVFQQYLLKQKHSKIDALNSDLNNAHNTISDIEEQLAKAKAGLNNAENEKFQAQAQAEMAKVNLRRAEQQLAEQRQRADHYEATSKDLKSTKTELSDLTNDHYKALKEMEAKRQLEKALMEEIAAKDKKISEPNSELSAAQNKN